MRFHWQNLNDKPYGKQGNPLKHFRCWWGNFGMEWVSLSGDFGIGFEIGGDNKWGTSFKCGLFSLYTHWSGWSSHEEREFKIYWYDKALWIAPWGRSHEWRAVDPWWVRGVVIRFDDLILGKADYWREAIETREVFIPMPEGSYPATVTMEYANWKRPRWFKKTIISADVKLPNAIPYEGKGENSWDCGEDGLYGMSCSARNVEEAIAKVVESAMRSRRKYGTPERIKPVLATESR